MSENNKDIKEELNEEKDNKIVDISTREKKAENKKADKSKAEKKPAKPKAKAEPKKAPKKEEEPKADKEGSKKPQKLTLDHLKKEDNKLVAKKSEVITIGGSEYEIIVDNHFRKTKKRDMINDMIKFFQMLAEKDMEDFEMATAYTMLLLVKHFTSLDVSDDIEEAIATLEVLIDTEAIGQIVSLLPEKEVVEMYDLLSETVDNMTKSLEDVETEIEKAEGDIENPEVKKYLKETLGNKDEESTVNDGEE